jgi:hypothetical protein
MATRRARDGDERLKSSGLAAPEQESAIDSLLSRSSLQPSSLSPSPHLRSRLISSLAALTHHLDA